MNSILPILAEADSDSVKIAGIVFQFLTTIGIAILALLTLVQNAKTSAAAAQLAIEAEKVRLEIVRATSAIERIRETAAADADAAAGAVAEVASELKNHREGVEQSRT